MTAAIYIRKSREDKTKAAHRLKYQRTELPAHAKKQGWDIRVYDDGHASAARGKTEDLTERARLEQDIKAGIISVVLVIELSRLSRDDSLQDYIAWLTLCGDHGVKLATLSRILDPAQHSDWMLLLMEGGFSSVEMRVLQSRMAEGRLHAIRSGKWTGGVPPPPYVYDKLQKKPVVDHVRLHKLKKLWTMAETHSAKAVAEELDMPHISVRRAISDFRLLFYQGFREDPETGDLIKGDWEPVMDAAQAKRIRDSRRTRKNTGKARPFGGLLSNLSLLTCGYCGRTVKVWYNSKIRKDGTRIDYYGCQVKNSKGKCPRSRTIPQHVIDERVINNIFGVLAHLAELRKVWLEEQKNKCPETQFKKLDAMEAELEEKKQRLVGAISDGIISFKDAKAQMDGIKARLRDLQVERDQVCAEVDSEPEWDDLQLTPEIFKTLPDEGKREWISGALEKIEVFNNYALLHYRFPRRVDGSRVARINLPAAHKNKKPW